MAALLKNTYVQMSIFLLIAFGLIYWQYVTLDPQQIDDITASFEATRWHYIFLALIVGLLSHVFRALRWRIMLNHLGHPTSKATITAAVLMGYLTNLLIPRLGEVVKCTTLFKYNDVPIEKSLGSVVSERIFDVLSLFVLFFLVLFLEYNQVSSYAHELMRSFEQKYNLSVEWWWLIILIIGGIVGFFILKIFLKKIISSRLGQYIQSFGQGIKSIITLPQRGQFIFYTAIIWMLYVVMVYVAMQAVPATQHLPFSVSMVLTAFGSIAIILTPGGIGAYPPIIAGLLMIYNIDYSYGLSAGWVSWLMQTVVVLILGIITLIYLPLSSKKQSKL